MTSRIKIVGVQFAANPDHEPETPMTAQENQRTIDLLTQLDRTHPRVSVKPEPTNAADKEALAVRLMSRKIGMCAIVTITNQWLLPPLQPADEDSFMPEW